MKFGQQKVYIKNTYKKNYPNLQKDDYQKKITST